MDILILMKFIVFSFIVLIIGESDAGPLQKKESQDVDYSIKVLKYSRENSSNTFKGEAIYFYENGENLRLKCRASNGVSGVLLYYGKDTFNITNKQMWLHMDSKSNNTHMICHFRNNTGWSKITFIPKGQSFMTTERNQYQEVQTPPESHTIPAEAVVVIIAVIAVGCWCAKHIVLSICLLAANPRLSRNLECCGVLNTICRKAWRPYLKLAETPYEDSTNQNNSSTLQIKTDWDNEYAACYSGPRPKSETYEKPGTENIDPQDHYYTKIDYSKCKPRTDGAKTGNIEVYDEPYVQITLGC